MSFPCTYFLLYVSCYSLEAVYEKYKGDRGRFEGETGGDRGRFCVSLFREIRDTEPSPVPPLSPTCLPESSKRTSDPFQTERPFFSVRIQVRAFSVNYCIFILFFTSHSNPGNNGIYRFFNAV